VRIYRSPRSRGGSQYRLICYSGKKRIGTYRHTEEDAIETAKQFAAFLHFNPNETIARWRSLKGKYSLRDSRQDIPPQLARVAPGVMPLTVPTGCFVYFLILNHEIVYVGQSRSLLARIGRHAAEGKLFDSVCYVRVLASELDTAEQAYIRHFKPMYNQTLTRSTP